MFYKVFICSGDGQERFATVSANSKDEAVKKVAYSYGMATNRPYMYATSVSEADFLYSDYYYPFDDVLVA